RRELSPVSAPQGGAPGAHTGARPSCGARRRRDVRVPAGRAVPVRAAPLDDGAAGLHPAAEVPEVVVEGEDAGRAGQDGVDAGQVAGEAVEAALVAGRPAVAELVAEALGQEAQGQEAVRRGERQAD